ncbi:MAG: hypothetical protein ACJ739_05925 [Acidimicrobiales bacterium]
MRASPNQRILLLAGQAFALGLTLVWITVPASAVFLSIYGPERLPVTYIGAALAGAMSSVVLSAALRRRPLVTVAAWVLAGLVVLVASSWASLALADADWVSFGLLALVPIVVPVGFIFIVGQAGLLLDVRTLKALYARVVAGFALGVVVGGLAAPILMDALGRPEHLLAAAGAAGAALLGLVVHARRRYPVALSSMPIDGGAERRPTLRSMTGNPFVRLIIAFQVLSAVESQWLDFLVFDRASQRYEDSDSLARFVSQFAAIAYGVDIVFLLLLAGLLLRRLGMRYGLTANSVGVLGVLAAVGGTTIALGSTAALVFVLVVCARVVDLTLSDGTSRTSLSAAYQAVPHHLRAVAQATVEGLAVPMAIGVSGVVLLLVDALGLTDGLFLPMLTAAVVVAWAVVATVLYRTYGSSLLASLRGRTLDASTLAVEDESSLGVIDRLVGSPDERDVRLGLDILTVAQHPGLHPRLERLAADERVGVRTDVLARLRHVAPHQAARAARDGLRDPSPAVRAACVRVLGAAGDEEDWARVLTAFDDWAPEVRLAATFSLTRLPDRRQVATVSTAIATLAASPIVEDRALAAGMLRECDPAAEVDRSPLRALLADHDDHVVSAGLSAVRWPEDRAVLPSVAHHLRDRRTAVAAVDVLVRAGDAGLDEVNRGLASTSVDRHVQELLVRVARQVASPRAVALLLEHTGNPDPDVGLSVLRALAAIGTAGSTFDDLLDSRGLAAALDDAEHATHVLRALVALDAEPGADLLRVALTEELELLRRRVLAALSMRHGTAGLERVAFQLAQRDERNHALAIEWLDVTLVGDERSLIALLEPSLPARRRLQRLRRTFPLDPLGVRAALLEVVRDDDRRWRPWIKACALYTTASIAPVDLRLISEVSLASTASGPESVVLQETADGLRARQLDLV